MNKIRLAQALVPIADELDERGLAEEAVELDEIISELMAEASVETEMMKTAQGAMPPPLSAQPKSNDPYGQYTGSSQWNTGPLGIGGATTPQSDQASRANAIAQIDKRIADTLRQLDEYRTQKYMLQGGASAPNAAAYKSQMIDPTRNQLQGAGQVITQRQ